MPPFIQPLLLLISIPRERQKRSNKRLFHRRERKPARDARNPPAQLLRKLNLRATLL